MAPEAKLPEGADEGEVEAGEAMLRRLFIDHPIHAVFYWRDCDRVKCCSTLCSAGCRVNSYMEHRPW